jgi:HAD superfamily hydrolase (TIGR01509 family)
MKPDPRYFRRGLRRFGLAEHEVVFIDDKPVNVEAAGAMGMRALWFRSPASLAARLLRLGVLG